LVDDLVTLGFLVLLQAVLGFDNLLYISLESKRAPLADQRRVRRLGIGLAVGARIVLLVILVKLVEYVSNTLFAFDTPWASGSFTLHALIVLAGGVFIIWTALKEIWHMVSLGDHAEGGDSTPSKTANQVIGMIVVMNLVFSFDSILSAMALTDTIWVMATAIIIGGILMIWLSDRVSVFLAKNRMYEVLGLFVLLIVGVMLVSEGGHLAELTLFGNPVHAMTKTTFYFVISVLIVTDLVQSRYQKKLLREQAARTKSVVLVD
jgi:predicted tellurium resistance membrane protein TerC